MQARVLAVANRKGGTGKSTIAVNLGTELGSRGYRVLIADLDPQGHAGLGFDIVSSDAERTVHAVFHKSRVDLLAAVRTTNEPNVDLIAADRHFDGQITRADPRCLAKALNPVKQVYDVILLDSPPVAANVIVCALLASEGVLVPTLLDHLALDGVRQFARAYHHVMCKLGATLLGFAIAPMQIDFRTNMQKHVLAQLFGSFGSDQIMRGVGIDVSVAEAFGHCRPLLQYRANARAVADFSVMADDVARRFNLP